MDRLNYLEQDTQIVPANLHASFQDASERLRFWEIDHYFKCPVVGMCIPLSDQKRLLKKAGISVKRKTPFKIHEILVSCSDKENTLSRKVSNWLDRKYMHDIERTEMLDASAFLREWKRCFESGGYAGTLWCAVTRRDLSAETHREIFGAIHMAMHGSAEEMARLRKQVRRSGEALEDLREKADGIRSEARALKRENRRLISREIELNGKLAFLEEEKARLEAECRDLRSQSRVSGLEQRILEQDAENRNLRERESERESRMEALEKEKAFLAGELGRERKAFEGFKEEAREIIGKVTRMSRCDESCPSFDLCRKRILIVGGIERMEELYRRFIEDCGGVFEYHDGHVKRGVKALENRFRRADVVLCPISCNSHAACSVVKNMGKKHNKPVHFLVNGSLNAVSRVLGENGGTHGTRH